MSPQQTTESRPETALDRIATIIQLAKRGDFTAHEAATRVFNVLGLDSGPLPPLPPPPSARGQ